MQHLRIRKTSRQSWTFPRLLPSLVHWASALGYSSCSCCFCPILLTSRAVPPMPVILEIQTAGESSSSVFSVFQVLFSIGWSPRGKYKIAVISGILCYGLDFYYENTGCSKLSNNLNSPHQSLQPSWLFLFPPALMFNTTKKSTLAQSLSCYCFREFPKSAVVPLLSLRSSPRHGLRTRNLLSGKQLFLF